MGAAHGECAIFSYHRFVKCPSRFQWIPRRPPPIRLTATCRRPSRVVNWASGQGARMGRKLFVGNLNFDTTSDDLKELFATAGLCESAQVMTDRATGRSRGFGFVEMSSDTEAQKAIVELNGRSFQGRNLNVNEARERTPGAPRGPRPSGDFGGNRGFDSGGGSGFDGFGGSF